MALGSTDRRLRILVLNRSYWPDVEATGQLLTELCEDLARTCDVTVIAGRPNQAGPAFDGLPSREYRNGVDIIRVASRRFDKASLVSRAWGLLSYLGRSAVRSLFVRRPDIVVVESDPPVLGLWGSVLRLRYQARLVNYLQDLHPEVGLAIGKLKPGPLAWGLRWVTQRGLRSADRVVVLGEDMRRRVIERGVETGRVAIVPNWSDTSKIRAGAPSESMRQQWGAAGRFVVMYSGNLGLSQNLDQVIDAAKALEAEPVVFVFQGEGASKAKLQQRVSDLGLTNVRFLPYAPKECLGDSLGAADVHLITMQAGLSGYLVPSKLYGILAAGRPFIAAVDADSEIGNIATRQRCGLRVDSNAPNQLIEAIRWCQARPSEIAEMGERGRELAEREFDRSIASERFRRLLESMVPVSPTPVPELKPAVAAG